jgi:hypothetical protein
LLVDCPGGGARAGDAGGWVNHDSYRRIKINGVTYGISRLAFMYMEGRWPEEADHRNRVRDDNKWDNLREATRSQNTANREAPKREGLPRGIYRDRNNSFLARIARRQIGAFRTLEEALAAREAAALAEYGEFLPKDEEAA